MNKTYYVTTPIYYPSNRLHIGNAYTTVAADVLARYRRLQGDRVLFLTGTDEHGQKIEQSARQAGEEPQAYVDRMYEDIAALWKRLDISYDRFIRTTDRHHEAAVQTIFNRLYEKGDIYKSEYEGWYCVSDEAFWTPSQLVEGRCPDCGGEVTRTREESYFFRLSNYADRLRTLLDEKTGFVVPASRGREMINNFIDPGLDDLAVTRTSFRWGVPVPFDDKHVIYVWIDALSNYITALGYPEETEDFQTFWPAQLQLIGKDIVRFHVVIWPALLMALDLPLPEKIYAHGWMLFDGGKMSKSKGNVVDPIILTDLYGSDAVRYFLMREMPYGSDGNFSNEALILRINRDLANDLGNLLSRTVAMIDRYFPDGLPGAREAREPDSGLLEQATGLADKVAAHLDESMFAAALVDIFSVIARANKYIDETTPWILAKKPEDRVRLATVLYNLADVLRILAVVLEPFLPRTPALIRAQLGLPATDPVSGLALDKWESAGRAGLFVSDGVKKGEALFPRLDVEKSLEELERRRDQPQKEEESVPEKALASFADFEKLELCIGTVKQAEKVKKADRLLRLEVDFGDETRQIVAGIALSYQPEDLIGGQYVFVKNLEPRKIRGLESQGMILTAEKNGGMALLSAIEEVAPGAGIR